MLLGKFLSQTEFSSYEEFREKFRIIVPENFNFGYDVVDAIADEEPNKRALVWCDTVGNDRTFTFADIKEYSNRAANVFKSMGIGKGDAVMLILNRNYHYWFCVVALHKIGAICIPGSHLLTSKDLVYRNNAASVKCIVALNDERVLSHIDEAQAGSPQLACKMIVGGQRTGWTDLQAALESASGSFPRPTGADLVSNHDVSLLYFTSGTTGMPKMVWQDFTYPLGHILTAKYWQNVRNNGLHFTVADTGWAKASWGKIYGQWIAGSAVMAYDFDRFHPKQMLEVIDKYNITTFCAPPTVFRVLVRENVREHDLSALEYCATAGEPLNPDVFNKWLDLTGHKIYEGFGQTETTVAIANYPWFEPKAGSMGKISPGYDIVLVNEHGQPCAPDEEGEVIIRTDKHTPVGMLGGYYRDDEGTERVWHDGTYHTGDIARYDKDGYYWYVSRADDVIKSSGYRIGPFEVESALLEHVAVLECAITGIPDDARGQIVKAHIVLAEGFVAGEELVVELQEHVRAITAPYKYPRAIEFVTELPRTISGKVKRHVLRDADHQKSAEAK